MHHPNLSPPQPGDAQDRGAVLLDLPGVQLGGPGAQPAGGVAVVSFPRPSHPEGGERQMIRTFSMPISFGADPEVLRKISRQLRRVLENQQRQEELMSTQQEVLDRIQREVAESRAETAETLTAIQAAVAYIQSVPQLVQKAVEAAQAANPDADLTPLTQLANDLNEQQGQLDQAQLGLNAALSTSQAPPPVTEPITEPVATDTTGVSGAILSNE